MSGRAGWIVAGLTVALAGGMVAKRAAVANAYREWSAERRAAAGDFLGAAAQLEKIADHYVTTGNAEEAVLALRSRAHCLRKARRLGEAITAYERAIQIGPRCAHPDLHRSVSTLHRLSERPGAELAAARSLVEAARCRSAAGQTSAAVQTYHEAVALAGPKADPIWLEALANLFPPTGPTRQSRAEVLRYGAELALRSGAAGLATGRRLLKASLALVPTREGYARLLSSHAADSPVLLDIARDMLRAFPDDADAHYVLGLDAAHQSRFAEAEAHLRRAAKEPRYAAGLDAMRRLRDGEKDVVEYVTEYESTPRYEPSYVPPPMSTGQMIWEVLKPSPWDLLGGVVGKGIKLFRTARRARRALRLARGAAVAYRAGRSVSRATRRVRKVRKAATAGVRAQHRAHLDRLRRGAAQHWRHTPRRNFAFDGLPVATDAR